jgi:hypothetical protein
MTDAPDLSGAVKRQSPTSNLESSDMRQFRDCRCRRRESAEDSCFPSRIACQLGIRSRTLFDGGKVFDAIPFAATSLAIDTGSRPSPRGWSRATASSRRCASSRAVVREPSH